VNERPAYAPTWYADTMLPVSPRKPLTSDVDVEVCVVGAGLAGLTTARELARRGWSVAVLEARRIAWNASGRNTGFVLPGFAQAIDVVVRRVGLDHAKALWGLSEAGVDYVRTTIEETGMRGVGMVKGGWLKVAKTDDAEDDLALVQLLGQDLGAVVEGWPAERVREVLKTQSYFHGIHFPNAFQIHPLNYALGLAAAAEASGARIFEESPALAIDADGVRKRITTPSGRLRASHIVLAGNVHLGAVMPRVSGTLLPVWTYVATTAPLGARIQRAIDYPGGVSDTDLADNHYRIVGDRLMWSGAMTTWESNPRRFARGFKAEIEEIYPQLRPVEIEHVWTGVVGNPLHRMPQIGELSPGVWLASGFGGHGINTTAMAGMIIASAIDESEDTWRMFLPFELVWAGGRIGRAAAQAHYWWYRSRERARARDARRREAEYRRSEASETRNTLEAEKAGRAEAPASARPPAAVAEAAPHATPLPATPLPAMPPVPSAEGAVLAITEVKVERMTRRPARNAGKDPADARASAATSPHPGPVTSTMPPPKNAPALEPAAPPDESLPKIDWDGLLDPRRRS
jgi:gamma-glutamylputrescine oxidase